MRVLLLKDVKGVGRRNEVREVSDGYARNFLFKQKAAVPADMGALQKKGEEDSRQAARVAYYHALADVLARNPLVMAVRVGKDGSVFSSVTAVDIQRALAKKDTALENVAVELSRPIKILGMHTVPVRFGMGVRKEIPIEIIADQQ